MSILGGACYSGFRAPTKWKSSDGQVWVICECGQEFRVAYDIGMRLQDLKIPTHKANIAMDNESRPTVCGDCGGRNFSMGDYLCHDCRFEVR